MFCFCCSEVTCHYFLPDSLVCAELDVVHRNLNVNKCVIFNLIKYIQFRVLFDAKLDQLEPLSKFRVSLFTAAVQNK